jgi:hypothetical protein
MDNFYTRLSQLSEYKGFKSVNKFALDGLNYSSSEKLNRLKKENTNPSVEILLDIANKFEEINIEWLLTGKGEMLRNNVSETKKQSYNLVSESATNYSNKIDFKEKLIEVLQLQNSDLRNDKIELQKDKELLARIINNRPSKEKSA